MADDQHDSAGEERKLKPAERREKTDIAFREIIEREKQAEEEKTARLREARLKRDAEQAGD